MPPLDTRALQARLCAARFPVKVDGIHGTETQGALDRIGGIGALDLHPSGLHSIVIHWTGGAAGVIDLEREHYHLIITQDAKAVPGRYRPEANADVSDGQYAAHTRAANSGRIGVAFDAMAGAVERPFDPGFAPITEEMVRVMAREVAALCQTYRIPVTPWTVLTHAEVPERLGIAQRGKWDCNWLPPLSQPTTPAAAGTRLRQAIRAALDTEDVPVGMVVTKADPPPPASPGLAATIARLIRTCLEVLRS